MRGLIIAIAILAGIGAARVAVDMVIPRKDQERIGRVPCNAGDAAIVDPIGNIVGCLAITPGSTFAKRG